MAIYDFTFYEDPKINEDRPWNDECIYCKSKMVKHSLKNFWKTDYKEIKLIHSETIKSYKEIHDLEDCYLDLNMQCQSTEVWINVCEICGWWKIVKDVSISAKEWQIWQFYFGVIGSLKQFDIHDISIPINEIEQYLASRYESRLSLHPKLFEEVTASIFENLGYTSFVTGFTHDGGIDIILEKDSKQIGVQVKRYKNKVGVEQIRSFGGALILSGYTEGIFVTTSDFGYGACKAANNFTRIGLPIRLINAESFYDALKIKRKNAFDLEEFKEIFKKHSISKLIYYGWSIPMNSL